MGAWIHVSTGSPRRAVGRSARLAAAALLLGSWAGVPATAAAASAPGTPVTWGANPLGQLGDGSTVAHTVPTAVPGLTDVVQVVGGREHVVALRSGGRVVAWGDNSYGQIGDGTFTDRPSPTSVVGLPSNVVAVATGHYSSFALTSDGHVFGWGWNSLGQLGDGTTTNRNRPVAVGSLTGIQQVVGGRDFSAALAADGTVWAWGSNANGECGDGTTTTRLSPVHVVGLTGVVQLAAGRNHALALRSDGTVWAWGLNASGQLGDGTKTSRHTPVAVSGLSNVVDLAAGADHSLAVTSNGSVWAWGEGGRGQLGLGTTTDRVTPQSVPGIANAASVDAGRDHSLVITTSGSLWAWGFDDLGQVGDGGTANRLTPFLVPGVSNAVDAGGGRNYSVVLESGAPDTVAPSAPGQPVGTSPGAGRVDLTFGAATDDIATTLTYQVWRHDGAVTTLAGTVSTAANPVTFTDKGGAPGSTYTYDVTASDGVNVGSASPMSDPITVATVQPGVIVSDGFDDGLVGWSGVLRVSSDSTRSAPTGSVPSIRGSLTSQTALAWQALPSTETNLCYTASVRVESQATAFSPIRFRTATGGAVARLTTTPAGLLRVRNDQTAALYGTSTTLPVGSWHQVGLCVDVAGAAGQLQATYDGAVVGTWTSNTGATPVGRIQIGTSEASTVTFNIDDVLVVRN
jgi:alpha-tubulin suppressor-like RCC1 family protein